MKKVARKDAANNRNHMIQTGGGSPMPPKRDDPFQQRILKIISTSAIGLFNPFDKDSSVPAVQDQGAMATVQKEDFPEAPQIEYIDISMLPTTVVVNGQSSDTDVVCETEQLVKKDTSSLLELLHKKKIESIELQKKLAVEEMERAKVQHDIEVQIKKQKLIQEKIKTNILLMKQRKLQAFRKKK